MRLARLDLTRYGKFTEGQLDFGPSPTDRPDLHIVYGPNEAGKSTAFSALLDILFGIEKQSRYDFLHPYNTMRIGAAIELGGAPARTFGRVKRQQNTLLDVADQPVGEAVLAGSLGGLDRTAYRHMFSLDDETLEKGGEMISASKGELGQLLFAASAGLAELSQTLEALRAEADTFHRGRAKSELGVLKTRLDALKSEREAFDTALPAYRKLVETREAGRGRYEDALRELTRLRGEANAVDRRLQALPRLGRLLAMRERLAPLQDLPHPPAHWRDALPDLQRKDVELATLVATCAAEIETLSAARDSVVLDTAILDLAPRVDGLGDMRDRYTGADKDLPERRRSLAEQEAKLGDLLRRLDRVGEIDPDRLILGASASGALRDLIEQRSGIIAKRDTAGVQHADAAEALAGAVDALAAVGEAPDGTGGELAGLKAALAAVRASDHAARRRQAEKTKAALLAEVDKALAGLRPWTGTVEDLAAGTAPRAGDVARWVAAMGEADQQTARAAADNERLTAERNRLVAERDSAGRFAGVVPEVEAAAIRRRRDDAWSAHRRDLRPDTADSFEAALRDDDRVMTGRLTHSDAAARLGQIGQALAVTEADLIATAQRGRALDTAKEELMNEIRLSLDALGWPPGTRLAASDLPDWLKQRSACLEIAERLRGEERALSAADAEAADARAQLAAALAAAGASLLEGPSLADLLARAEVMVDRESRVAALRAQAGERRATLSKATRDLARAEANAAAWQSAWTQACAACWVGERGAAPSVATVRTILDSLAELGPLLVQRADLALRIDKMEADQARYASAVDRLTAELTPGAPPEPPLDRAAALASRLAAAREGAARHREIAARLAELDVRRETLRGERAAVEQRIGAMTAFFGVTTLAEVATRLDDTRTRAELANTVREIEGEIVDLLRTPTLGAAEAILAAADRTALEGERDALQPRIEDLEGRTRALYAESTRAEDALAAVGGDDRVARLSEQRRTLLLETEDKARHHLGLRIGIAAAEMALRSYRDQHRSSMMQRASDAFRIVSRGAYSGLAAQPGDKGDTLVAVGPNSSKKADDLSKGTRFQLYLALRVAGYHEYCRSREPVPFVADDIMETFDDFRAEEAFRLFAGMAEVGQVIYLTHHRHLCDIARSVCPGVRVIELPAAA